MTKTTIIPASANQSWGLYAELDVHAPAAWPLAMTAIAAATRQWMGWTIDRQTSRDYGIPSRLPHLTGFVVHCAIEDGDAAA